MTAKQFKAMKFGDHFKSEAWTYKVIDVMPGHMTTVVAVGQREAYHLPHSGLREGDPWIAGCEIVEAPDA